VSAWAAVLDDVAARGGTPAQVAARLGLPGALVHAILDHAARLGVVAVASGCGTGCPTGPDAPPGCAGCPLGVSGKRQGRQADR
jgi:hypothetical protein